MTAEAKATPPVCKRHVAWRQVDEGLWECAACGSICKSCAEGWLPSHEASKGCQSGKRPHCTCDTCF